MKNKISLAILATLLIILFAHSVQPRDPQTTTPSRYRWEYKIETPCTQSKANELGDQGWELVSVLTVSDQLATTPVCAFKREK
jgi:hypothetical protein